jgi:small subunit ribosomal protein S8
VIEKLAKLGYVKGYKIEGDKVKKIIIDLAYDAGASKFTDVKIYSTPGRRWYIKSKELRPVLGGLGFSILSTPDGILTNIEARKKNIGGELLFDIW